MKLLLLCIIIIFWTKVKVRCESMHCVHWCLECRGIISSTACSFVCLFVYIKIELVSQTGGGEKKTRKPRPSSNTNVFLRCGCRRTSELQFQRTKLRDQGPTVPQAAGWRSTEKVFSARKIVRYQRTNRERKAEDCWMVTSVIAVQHEQPCAAPDSSRYCWSSHHRQM